MTGKANDWSIAVLTVEKDNSLLKLVHVSKGFTDSFRTVCNVTRPALSLRY